ncbi:MAG: diaminopimelate epimerase, partial [Bacteroidota bacterium]
MLTFFKYQGTGNDFVLIDNQSGEWENRLSTDQIQRLCDRRFGIGADGLMLLSPHPELDFRMVYYNADGKESSMCGNGGRCLVAFAQRMGIQRDTYRFEAIDGLHEAILVGEEVRLKMGTPQGYRTLPESQYWIDTGSPHLVVWAKEGVKQLSIADNGRILRYDPRFAPGGVNV